MGTVESQIATQVTDGFHLVIDALKLNGIDTIFGLPGIPITDFTRMAQATGLRVISFRHEQNAGNAAAIAGFLTQKPGICLTVSAPGFLNGLTALANATTNCFPMILISGSSEREIVDLQQGDYEEMDQLAIAKPLCKAAFRVLHAADIGIGVARAIRAAVSGRPGGVYLDLPSKLIQIDIEPKEMDSNVEITAPLVGDIGSCVSALLEGMGSKWQVPPTDWTHAIKTKREENIAKMAPRLMKNSAPMDFHGALGALRTVVKERPDAILVNEGANTLDLARGVIDMYQPRKRLDVGTWGVMGIGMGFAIAAAIETGKPVLAVEGDSAFGFSGMEVETICRYNLPVCIVVFNNNGIYRGTDVNSAGSDPATTVFVKDSRYDKMMEAFGGVGINVTTPDELKRAVDSAMDSGKPTLINAVIDPAAGSESGRIGNLNPQSVLKKK